MYIIETLYIFTRKYMQLLTKIWVPYTGSFTVQMNIKRSNSTSQLRKIRDHR